MFKTFVRRLRRPPSKEARVRWFNRQIRTHRAFSLYERDELAELVANGDIVLTENTFISCPGYHPLMHGTWMRTMIAA
jgi:hypothetical protein